MQNNKLYTILLLFAITVMVSACGGGGATNENTTYTTTTTLGQELTDLKKAHDDGVINDEEYQAARKKILNRYDK